MTEETQSTETPSLSFLQNSEALRDIFVKLHKRSQQDFLNATEAQWKVFVDQMAERIQRRFWRECQQHVQWSENRDPILFPENTRLFYTKGDTTVIFVEQKPMVRTVRVSARLVLENADPKEADRMFSIGFPFIVYTFKFRSGKFVDGNLFFSNAPLRSLADKPLLPCLPNLGAGNCKICFGSSLMNHHLGTPFDYSGQIEKVLDYYWNSTFTTDWRTNFDSGRKADPRVVTFRKWSEETKKNPMFPVEVNWPRTNYETFRHLCTTLFSDEPKMREMKKEIYDSILSEEVQDAFRKFRRESDNENTSIVEAGVLASQFIGTVQELMRSPADVSSLRSED